jgi:hypothetical protein
MKGLIKGIMILMMLLLALGVTMLVLGAVHNANRPLTPRVPDGSVRHTAARDAFAHV